MKQKEKYCASPRRSAARAYSVEVCERASDRRAVGTHAYLELGAVRCAVDEQEPGVDERADRRCDDP